MAQPPDRPDAAETLPNPAFSRTPERFSTTPQPGGWTMVGGASALRDLTAIPKNAADAQIMYGTGAPGEIDSLPDMWSQIEGFADALFAPNHERHGIAVRQWRGLLACLALAGEVIPNLSIRKIDMGSGHPFVAAASRLTPRLPVLKHGYLPGLPNKLDEIGLLHLDRSQPPIGLLVPTTFVAPARSRQEALAGSGRPKQGASWLTERAIGDPTTDPNAVDRISSARFALLRAYIVRLWVSVAGAAYVAEVTGQPAGTELGLSRQPWVQSRDPTDPARVRIEALASLLEDYWRSAKKAGDAARLRDGLSDTDYRFERATRPEITDFVDPLYNQYRLQQIETIQFTGGVYSSTRIRTRSNCGIADVLLADPTLAFDGAENIVVFEQTTVMHLRENAQAATAAQQAAARRDVLIVTPADLFTDTLIEITDGSVNGHSGQTANHGDAPLWDFVLPLTPLALMLLDDLAGPGARVRMIRNGEEEVQVSLRVDLLPAGANGPRVAHEIRKTFRSAARDSTSGYRSLRGGGADRRAGMSDTGWLVRTPYSKDNDALAMWPNLDGSVWHDFQFYGYATIDLAREAPALVPLWPVQGKALETFARSGEDPASPISVERVLGLARDWASVRARDKADASVQEVVVSTGDVPIVDSDGRQIPRGAEVRRLQARRRPEAYLIAAATRQDLRGGAIETLKLAGLILIPPAQAPSGRPSGGLEIGLDFGSSNTTVYLKQGGEAAPQRLTLQAHRLDLLTSPSGAASELGQLDFAPIKDRPFPIPSLLDMHSRTLMGVRDAEFVPGSAGSVAVVLEQAVVLGRAFAGSIEFNIKWLNDGVAAAKRYLDHLCLMVLAEAAQRGIDPASPGAITWRVSYPSAYNKQRHYAFRRAIADIVHRLQRSELVGSDDIGRFTESVCTARYFQSVNKGSQSGTTIVMDIGGGTTDMAVWQHADVAGPLLWQSSVRFAGRELVVEPIARDLLVDGGVGPAATILDLLADMQVTASEAKASGDFNAGLSRIRERKKDLVANGAVTENGLNYVGLMVNTPHFAQYIPGVFAHLPPDGPADRTLDVIALGFGGVLWFVGKQLRQLVDDAMTVATGTDAQFERRLSHFVSVCLAGRPSLLMRFLIQERAGLEQIYKTVLIKAAGLAETTQIVFDYSDHPKEEVARGLLLIDPGSATDVGSRGTIQGEATVDPTGISTGATTLLPDRRGRQSLQIDPTAPETLAFLKIFNDAFEKEEGSPLFGLASIEQALPGLVNQANLVLNNGFRQEGPPNGADNARTEAEAGPRPLTMEVQPPFFALLREVMRQVQYPGTQARG